MTATLTVAAIQHAAYPNKQETLNFLRHAIAENANKGANLIVLQELHNTPYFCQHENTVLFDLAETQPTGIAQRIVSLNQQTRSESQRK